MYIYICFYEIILSRSLYRTQSGGNNRKRIVLLSLVLTTKKNSDERLKRHRIPSRCDQYFASFEKMRISKYWCKYSWQYVASFYRSSFLSSVWFSLSAFTSICYYYIATLLSAMISPQDLQTFNEDQDVRFALNFEKK